MHSWAFESVLTEIFAHLPQKGLLLCPVKVKPSQRAQTNPVVATSLLTSVGYDLVCRSEQGPCHRAWQKLQQSMLMYNPQDMKEETRS